MAREFDFNAGNVDGRNKGIEGEQGSERGTSGSATIGEPISNGSGKLHSAEDFAGGTTKTRSKRGRPFLPRDEFGNIIRDGSAQGTGSAQTQGTKKPKGVALDFIPNDREAIRGSIQGLHAMCATLLKAPILLLSDANARNLSERLADVMDFHKINITGNGGPWGLYLALAMCAYGIYSPMLKALSTGQMGMELTGATVAPTTGDQKNVNIGGMDFSSDVVPGADRTVSEVMNENEAPEPGVFSYG